MSDIHKGSCVCGQVTYQFEGKPEAFVVCHCHYCRKTSSASATHNIIVNEDKLKVKGDLKHWTRKGDSGKDVTYGYCTTCPTIVTVDAQAMAGTKMVKGGTCDDEKFLRETVPNQEIYCKNRYPWVPAIDGPEQHEEA